MTLRSLIQKVPRRVFVAAATAVAVVAVPAGLLAWGPSRATFTIANPASYVTFNSITDNPNIGDERNFVGIRESGTTGLWQDSQAVTPGKEYVVRLYVHNNAASNLNLVAENVKASVNLPTNTAKSIEVQGFINSSNAKPTEVYDHATFTSDQNFNLAYVPGTLKYNNNANGNGFTIPESVFTSNGASLGYDKMDGKIPGCFQYAGYLTFIVKPQFAATPDFTAEKLVSKHGASQWVDNYTAQPGETVDYLLKYKNTSTIQQDDVTLRDTLPANMTYVAGSTTYANSEYPSGTAASDNVTTTGINIGSYAAGANAWVKFSAKVAGKDALPCGESDLVNKVTVTTKQGGSKSDTATVEVNKECQPPKKVQACNLDTKAIEQVEESKIDNIHYTLDLDKCKEEKTIEVCRLSDKKYPVTIKEGEYDSSKYSKNPEDCKEKEITVCRLSDKKYPVTIKESEYDSSKYSKNPEDCKTPEDKDITVCRLSDKVYPVTIKESAFDSTKYSKNPNDCKTPETPMCEIEGKEDLPADSKDCVEEETPTELPHTGMGETFLSVLGLGSVVSATGAYIASRRK